MIFDTIDQCVRLKTKDYRRNRIEPLRQLVLILEENDETRTDVLQLKSSLLIDILRVSVSSIDRKTLWKDDQQRSTASWICRLFICSCRIEFKRDENLLIEVFQWLRETKEFQRNDEDLLRLIFQLIEQFTRTHSDLNEMIVNEFFLVEPERKKRHIFCSRRRRTQSHRSICILDFAVDLVMHYEDLTLLLNQILNVFLLFASNVRFTNYLIHHTDFYRLHLSPLFTGERTDSFIRHLIDELARSQTDSTDRVFLYTNFLRLIGEFVQHVELPIISFLSTLKKIFDALVDCGTTISLFYLIETFRQLLQRSDPICFVREFHRIGLTTILIDFIVKLVQRKVLNALQNEILISSLTILNEFVRIDRENLPKEKLCDEICRKILLGQSIELRLLSSLILIEFDSNLDDPNLAEQLINALQNPSERISISILLKSLKKLVFHDEKQIEILFEILTKLDDDDISTSFDILLTMSMDDRWAKLIHQNDKFFALLVQISETHSNEFIREKSRSILRQTRTTLSHRPSTNLSSSHIMFSYNHESKDLVYRICHSLRQQNFNIWLDIDHMHGDTLETMAQAIEQASLVVICLTDKYKQSANCQSEARYAYRSNKPILPLVLQAKYKPTGWLGMILGTKFYIDFTKNNFDVNMQKLVKEIQTMIS